MPRPRKTSEYQSAVGHYYFDKRRRAHGPYKTKKARLAAQRKKNPGGPLDTHAAKELELFVENDADLYRQQYTPINKNLITKMARGVYNHAGAVKLFGYLMESGAKKYNKQFGGGGSQWHEMFSPATRKAAAEVFAHHFEVEAKLGNYDSLLPKKYSDWRLKSNPNRLTDVLVRRGGKVFKAKAKYDAGRGKVRIFVAPDVARKVNPRGRYPDAYSTQIDTSRDFHTLSSREVEQVLAEADAQKYRKPKNASGSRARYFYQKLQREAARGRR